MNWIANDGEAARALREIDERYERARAAARNLPLALKLDAYRKAANERDKARAAVVDRA